MRSSQAADDAGQALVNGVTWLHKVGGTSLPMQAVRGTPVPLPHCSRAGATVAARACTAANTSRTSLLMPPACVTPNSAALHARPPQAATRATRRGAPDSSRSKTSRRARKPASAGQAFSMPAACMTSNSAVLHAQPVQAATRVAGALQPRACTAANTGRTSLSMPSACMTSNSAALHAQPVQAATRATRRGAPASSRSKTSSATRCRHPSGQHDLLFTAAKQQGCVPPQLDEERIAVQPEAATPSFQARR